MSQELIGACGSAVGTSDYFQRINQGTIFAPFMTSQDGYQYSSAVGQLCSRCAAVIDEIYSDLQGVAASIPKLSPEYKDNLTKLISSLEEAASFLAPAYTSANGCLSLLTQRESSEENSIFGIWGLDIGSLNYMQSKCSGIFPSAFADPLSSITQTLVSDLAGVAEQIAGDIETGVRLHHYIKGENGEALKTAMQELNRCNCSVLSLSDSKVSSLCWYHNTPSDRVLALQKALNKIPTFGMLTEDGVYGEKTSNAYSDLLSNLVHGTFPSLTFVDPFQSQYTGVRVRPKITKDGQTFSQVFIDGTDWPIFRADRHRFGTNPDFAHVNVSSAKEATTWQNSIADALDHRGISEDAYNLLKNFDDTAKIVKIGGKVLLIAGAVMDAIELGNAIQSDLNDADQKLGKTTALAGASIIGSWGGGALGAEVGAYAGAMIGTAIFPGVGTLIGGALGGVVIGIAGSAAGSILGEWIVDITDIWE